MFPRVVSFMLFFENRSPEPLDSFLAPLSRCGTWPPSVRRRACSDEHVRSETGGPQTKVMHLSETYTTISATKALARPVREVRIRKIRGSVRAN